MEQETETLNDDVEVENNIDDSSLSEAEATEDTEPEVPEAAAEESEGTVETEESSNKGYSNRVRQLNAEKKAALEEAQSLKAKLAELTGQGTNQGYVPPAPVDDEPIMRDGEEIDAVEFNRRLQAREQKVIQRTEAMIELKSRQSEAVNRINNEAEQVMKKYPELDPSSSTFNKELSDAISEATEAYVTKNPYTASVIKFADKMMRPYKGAVSKEVGDMTGKLAKQVSESAVKPTSVRAKEKPAKEKSIAELEAQLGIVQA